MDQHSTPAPHTGHRRAGVALAALVTAALLGACTDDGSWRGAGPDRPPPAVGATGALVAARGCDQLTDGLPAATTTVPGMDDEAAMLDDGAGIARAGTAASAPGEATPAAPAAADELVGTNVQEAGVEEADLVAVDGERLVWVVGDVLRVTLLDDTPGVDGELVLPVGTAGELFLLGDRALVLGSSREVVGGPMPVEPGGGPGTARLVPPPAGGPSTTLTMVSLADPGAPRVEASASVEGELVTARRTGSDGDGRGGTTRVVVRSTPTAVPRAAAPTAGPEVLPRVTRDGATAPLGTCSDVWVPEDAAGPTSPGADAAASAVAVPSTVTVLSIRDDLGDLAPVSVQVAAEAVYASPTALYVAGTGWDEGGTRTDVHRFDIAGSGPAVYTGSGTVPGRLLDQFALSERSGALRVVTTLDGAGGGSVELTPPAGAAGPLDEPASAPLPRVTEGRLTVLDTDGALEEVSHVDGLGPNEEVRSVRFVDDMAYVVTFRRTDPLYAVDLSDPAAPRVLGELKITGFSEYLHPVGDGRLLGVGREVDPATGADTGLKVSLFDVSDPTAPAEVDRFVLPGAWSDVGADHHALTWDPRRSRAILPVGQAALVVGVEGSTLVRAGEIRHDGPAGPVAPLRSRIVDGWIWTVSDVAVGRTPADRPTGVEQIRY